MSEIVTVLEEVAQVIVAGDAGVDVVAVVEEASVVIADVGLQGKPGPPGSGGGATMHRETPPGSIDGLNAVFTTSVPYAAGSTLLFLNGLAQDHPDDYVESSPTMVTFVDPPLPGDRLVIQYSEA